MTRPAGGLAVALLCFALFAALATANAGGYRYGISDQSYYGMAVLARANPALYPKDIALVEAQSHFLLADDLFAWLVRTFGIPLPPLFFAVYTLTLAALFAASIAFARRLGLSWWAIAAMLLLLTLRHRISKTGVNTLEGYAHVRMLAFAFGVAALTCLASARVAPALLWLALAAVFHPTTAVWFALAIAMGALMTRREWRRAVLWAALPVVGLSLWTLVSGPLAGRLTIMDAAWLDVLKTRDYFFPSAWPAYAWIANLAYPIVIFLIFRARLARGLVNEGERAVTAGMFGLLLVFLVSVPLSAMHVALAVQLQFNRVFWLMDFVTAVYVAWWLIDLAAATSSVKRVVLVSLLAALAIGRGAYVLAIETDRRVIEITPPPGPWTDAMAWLRQQPAPWHVLADPAHAWTYGINVRLAGEKDVLLDITKDPAIASYDRAIAMRVAERSAALADFDRFTTADVRALASRYNLDVLVVDATRAFDFPVLYRNSGIVVYDLR